MSKTNGLWMDEVEQIGDMYANGEMPRDEAIRELERKGFGTQEARDMLDGVR